jgi:YVTN family beta-propeller protein
MKPNLLPLLAVLVIAGPALAADTPAPGYHIVNKISVPGEGGWDYLMVDEPSRTLYIAHGDRVQALDADTGELKGTVKGLKGTHGVAILGGKGFISDGKDNAVDVFDLKTFKVTKEVKAGKNPDCIYADGFTNQIFAFNGASQDATVIDAKTLKVVGTIPLGGKPEFAAADGKGFVYVNIEDKSELVKIDAKALKETARWPLAPCEEPSSLAIDSTNGRLFAGCHNNKLAIVDSTSGKIVATPAIGSGVDAGWFDPATSLVFTSNGEGTVTVLREETPDIYTAVETVSTQKGSRTSALDRKTHKLFLAGADFGPMPETKPGEHKRPPIVAGSFKVLVLDR